MWPQCALWTTPARPRQELGGGGGSRNARRALRLLLRCAALAIRAHCRPHARRNGADLLLQQRLEVQQRLVALQHSQSVGLVPRSAVAPRQRRGGDAPLVMPTALDAPLLFRARCGGSTCMRVRCSSRSRCWSARCRRTCSPRTATPASAPGLGSPPPTSAPGLGSPRRRLRRDWAHPRPNLRRDWAHPDDVCAWDSAHPRPHLPRAGGGGRLRLARGLGGLLAGQPGFLLRVDDGEDLHKAAAPRQCGGARQRHEGSGCGRSAHVVNVVCATASGSAANSAAWPSSACRTR